MTPAAPEMVPSGDRLALRRETRPELRGEGAAIELLANEDERVGARVGAPFVVELRVEQHVDALEDEALGRALDAEHALHAINVTALHAEQLADPRVELSAVEVAGGADADGRDGVVVGVRGVEILMPAGLHRLAPPPAGQGGGGAGVGAAKTGEVG